MQDCRDISPSDRTRVGGLARTLFSPNTTIDMSFNRLHTSYGSSRNQRKTRKVNQKGDPRKTSKILDDGYGFLSGSVEGTLADLGGPTSTGHPLPTSRRINENIPQISQKINNYSYDTKEVMEPKMKASRSHRSPQPTNGLLGAAEFAFASVVLGHNRNADTSTPAVMESVEHPIPKRRRRNPSSEEVVDLVGDENEGSHNDNIRSPNQSSSREEQKAEGHTAKSASSMEKAASQSSSDRTLSSFEGTTTRSSSTNGFEYSIRATASSSTSDDHKSAKSTRRTRSFESAKGFSDASSSKSAADEFIQQQTGVQGKSTADDVQLDQTRQGKQTGEEAKRAVEQSEQDVFVPGNKPSGSISNDTGECINFEDVDEGKVDYSTSSHILHEFEASSEQRTLALAKQNNPTRKKRASSTANIDRSSRQAARRSDLSVKCFLQAIASGKTRPKPKRIKTGESLEKKKEAPIPRGTEQRHRLKKRKLLNGGVERSYLSIFNKETPARHRSPRYNQQMENHKEPEIVEIHDDTDDEDDKPETKRDYDAVRIAIGQFVEEVECKVIFHTHRALSLEFRHNRRVTRSNRSSERAQIDIDLHNCVDELSYFRAGETTSRDDDFSFLAIRSSGSLTEVFKQYSRSYDPSSQDPGQRFVIVEFREDSDLDSLLVDLKSLDLHEPKEPKEVEPGLEREYCRVLLEHSQEEATRRNSFQPNRQIMKSPDTGRDEILVVYPFAGDEDAIEKAAENLKELKDERKAKHEYPEKDGPKGSNRDHFLTIQVSDFLRLEEEQYLNDTIIDFWMKWYVCSVHVLSVVAMGSSQIELNSP